MSPKVKPFKRSSHVKLCKNVLKLIKKKSAARGVRWMFSQFQMKCFNKLEKRWKHIPIFQCFQAPVPSWILSNSLGFPALPNFQTSNVCWKALSVQKWWGPCSSFWACSGGRPAAPFESELCLVRGSYPSLTMQSGKVKICCMLRLRRGS